MSEIKNGGLGLYNAGYSKCNHVMTLGFKGLMDTCSQCRPVLLVNWSND